MDQKPEILVVDDNVNLALNLKDILEGEGYNTAVAHDGQSALALCAEKVFDLAFIDIKLPDTPGVELVDKLAELLPGTEYVIITGYASLDSAIASVEHRSVVAYETKPLDINHLLSLTRQVIGRKRAEDARWEAKERFRIIVETAPSLLTITDAQGNNLYISPNCEKITGYTQEELQGRVLWWVHEDDIRWAKEFFERTFRLGVGGKDFEYKAVKKNGEVWYASNSWEPLRDGQGKLTGMVFQTADITERKKEEERGKYLSFHDSLTGLYSRAFFEEEMKRLNNVRKYPVGIIMADVNKLKFINDAFGHAEGDEILKRMANILASATRGEDVVARIGGDEFAIILPNVDEETARSLCSRIIDACKNSNREASLKLTVSLGYSIHYGQYKDMQEALGAADDHMYRDKLVSSKAVRGNVIDTLIAMLTKRDIHRKNHSNQLQQLAISLGQDKGLSEHRLEELRLLVILYDIGKIGISDSILNKPENLTSEEWEAMKKHCAIGHRIANNVSELVPVANDILCHHEWWNGKGYPRGLKGEEIPLLARIISIVDAYYAMLSDRPYRRAMSRKEAIKEIKKGASTQFDPELVERFLKIVGEDSTSASPRW